MLPRLPRALRWTRWIGLALAIVLGTEGALRWIILSPGSSPAGTGLRDPSLFFQPATPEWWILRAQMSAEGGPGAAVFADPVLGWTNGRFSTGDRAHQDEGLVGDQRPVLLLGDSFSECAGDRERCFEDVLEEGPFGPTHQLLNYGVGGYGFDQTLLLSFEVMERFAGQDPVVVLGLLIDDDLDRCILPFRGAPKPQLRAVGERRVEVARRPEPLDRAEWLAAHPLEVPWWSWRWFDNQFRKTEEARQAESGLETLLEEMRVTVAAGVLEWKDRLDALGLEGFVMIFSDRARHEGHPNRPDRLRWFESVLEGHGVPWVRAWEEIDRDRQVTGRGLGEYFKEDVPAKGHYLGLGNEVTTLALERGLRRAFDGPSIMLHDRLEQGRTGVGAFSRWERFAYGPFGPDHVPHVLLRPGEGPEGRAWVTFAPERPVRSLTLRVEPYPDVEGRSHLVIGTAEGEALRLEVAAGDAPRELEVALPEVSRIEFFVEPIGDEPGLPVLCIHPSLDGHPHTPMLVPPPKD